MYSYNNERNIKDASSLVSASALRLIVAHPFMRNAGHCWQRDLAALLVGFSFLLTLAGCGAQPVTGGTAGDLTAGGEPLSEVQLTVHQVEGTNMLPLGFAISSDNGSFELVTNGAQGPLILTPGEYRVTLESAGAPVFIPPEFASPQMTPLKFNWPTESPRLLLKLPEKLRIIR